MRLGFIGTGTMGDPMVRCLLEAGHQVKVNDLNREATTALCELGATWAETPQETAEHSQVVFTSLPGPTQVEAVLMNPESGILAALGSGSAFIDMTTNAPSVARRLAEICRQRGISEQTYCRWKAKYGGLELSEAKKLRRLEEENRKLKQLVGELSLDKQALRDVLSKNF